VQDASTGVVGIDAGAGLQGVLAPGVAFLRLRVRAVVGLLMVMMVGHGALLVVAVFETASVSPHDSTCFDFSTLSRVTNAVQKGGG
jgi:hypothetical protein